MEALVPGQTAERGLGYLMSQRLLSPTAALCLPVAGLGQRMDHLHSLAVFHNCPSDLEILGAVLSQLLRSQSA